MAGWTLIVLGALGCAGTPPEPRSAADVSPSNQDHAAASRESPSEPIDQAGAVTLARRAFQRGMEAAEGEQWCDAADAFEEAYELTQRDNLLLNLGATQAQCGRLAEALNSYEDYLADAVGTEEMVTSARASLANLRERTPHVRMIVNGFSEVDILIFDDEELSRTLLGREYPINPGSHRLVIQRDGQVLRQTEIEAAERQRQTIELTIPPPPDELLERLNPEESSVFESFWFWSAVVVALAAGGVAVGVVLANQDDPLEGNLGRFEFNGE